MKKTQTQKAKQSEPMKSLKPECHQLHKTKRYKNHSSWFLLVINDGGGFNRHQVHAVRWSRIWMVELCGGTTDAEIVGKPKNSDVEDWDAAAKRSAGSIFSLSLSLSFSFFFLLVPSSLSP